MHWGYHHEYALWFKFRASNNESEYEALIAGLRLAKFMGARSTRVFSNSQLVVNQINEKYQAKDERMAEYFWKVGAMLGAFENYEVEQIPRSKNFNANELAWLASSYEIDLPSNSHGRYHGRIKLKGSRCDVFWSTRGFDLDDAPR